VATISRRLRLRPELMFCFSAYHMQYTAAQMPIDFMAARID
jgi:hypothetical protein